MTKKELKQKLIDIRNGALITPILEELWEMVWMFDFIKRVNKK